MTRLFLLLLLTFVTHLGAAHELSMAEMEVRETRPGEFMWQWTATGVKPLNNGELTPVWPRVCEETANVLRCGDDGLKGELTIEGVGDRFSAAMVKVFWLDGEKRVYTLTAAQPSIQLYGSADDKRGLSEIGMAYFVLGVEHILMGFDHLMFVFALLFLVGFNKRLVLTITAFTVAHSITLVTSALGLLTLRSGPVEASIALSIVLVTAEALRDRETLARRLPALVAFLFGLLHGFGFAGALTDIGLPQNHLPVALLTFNVGVEVGQLLVVCLAFVLTKLAMRLKSVAIARKPLLYAMGIVAAFWSWQRVIAIAG